MNILITNELNKRKFAAPQDRGAGGPAISDIQNTGQSPVRIKSLLQSKISDIFEVEPFSESMQTTIENIHENAIMPDTQDMAETDPTFDQGFSEDASISDFLSRPVKIASHVWAVGGDLSAVQDPWIAFIANPAVSDKLNNYKLLRGNLKLTVYVNGTPQHAGLAMLSYSFMSKSNEFVTIGGDTQLVTYSQRPRLFIVPQVNKGGCLCIPFMFPENYIDLQEASNTPGQYHLSSFAPLKQNNSGTNPVTVTVFAHLTDVVLTAPTTKAAALSAEGLDRSYIWDVEPFNDEHVKKPKKKRSVKKVKKDEYHDDGPVSSIASAVAKAAGELERVPVIGPFAVATSMAADAVGGIASFFGFSKPAQIGDIGRMINTPVGDMALSDGKDTSAKMSLTAKQEITIDPRTFGMDGEDCLSLKYWASKESYITKFDFTNAQLVDQYIFAIAVTPSLYRLDSVTFGDRVIPTAIDHISRPFEFWSGTLEFRFIFIASQFHRGRLAIIYDPSGSPGTVDPYNTTYSTIVDLSEGRDVTISVPWMQAKPYKKVDQTYTTPTNYTVSSPGAFATDQFSNGVLYVRVLNDLNSPDNVTDVTCCVFVRGGDDFEVANPNGSGIQDITYAVPTSTDNVDSSYIWDVEPFNEEQERDTAKDSEAAPEIQEETIVKLGTSLTYDDMKALVFFGEAFTSIRQLMKRFTYYRYQKMDDATSANAYRLYYQNMPSMPYYFGPDATDGIDTIAGGAGFNTGTTFMQYFSQAYAGWRGGIRYKMVPTSASAGSTLFWTRQNGRTDAYSQAPQQTAMTAAGTFNAALSDGALVFEDTTSGASGTNRNMLSKEVELPYASPYRFSLTSRDVYSNSESFYFPGGYSTRWIYSSGTTFHPADALITYCAVADDFTFTGFVGAPVYYIGQGR